MTKVGDTIWVFDSNRRRYTEPAPGRIWGDLIWREHWDPRKIEGETSRSWIVRGRKIPKIGADPNHVAFSKEDIDRAEWVHLNRHRVVQCVHKVRDHGLLRKIADLVGYKGETTEGP